MTNFSWLWSWFLLGSMNDQNLIIRFPTYLINTYVAKWIDQIQVFSFQHQIFSRTQTHEWLRRNLVKSSSLTRSLDVTRLIRGQEDVLRALEFILGDKSTILSATTPSIRCWGNKRPLMFINVTIALNMKGHGRRWLKEWLLHQISMKAQYPCVHPVSLRASQSLSTSQVNSAQMWDQRSKHCFSLQIKKGRRFFYS